MKIIKRMALTLAILAIFLGLAHIAHSEPLTPKQVERFIASMPELNALGEKHEDDKPRQIDRARPLGSSLELMGSQSAAYADLAQLASHHGFSSAEHWADVGDRTMRAYAIATSTLSSDEVEAAYQQGIANVNNDPGLTAAQKEAVLAGMAKGHKRNMDARQAAEKDLAAVQPHLATLNKLFE